MSYLCGLVMWSPFHYNQTRKRNVLADIFFNTDHVLLTKVTNYVCWCIKALNVTTYTRVIPDGMFPYKSENVPLLIHVHLMFLSATLVDRGVADNNGSYLNFNQGHNNYRHLHLHTETCNCKLQHNNVFSVVKAESTSKCIL